MDKRIKLPYYTIYIPKDIGQKLYEQNIQEVIVKIIPRGLVKDDMARP